MVRIDHSARKESFDRAFCGFFEAHARGMQSLSERNVRGLHQAIADECAAARKASEAIGGWLRILNPNPDGGSYGGADPSIQTEHRRLVDRMAALDREHHDVKTRPFDRDAHREHRARLHAHIDELRVHLQRLGLQSHHDPASDQ